MSTGSLATARRLLAEALDALCATAASGADDELVGLLAVCEATARRIDRIAVDAVAALERRGTFTDRGYSSPVAANGNIYLTTLEDGTVTVLKAGTTKPEVVAKNPPLGERVAATPAIADDIIYIRTAGNLYAFGEK